MTNLEIAQSVALRPIEDVAAEAGLRSEDFEVVGKHKAKLTFSGMRDLGARTPSGKLVLVTAITPTPAGEGKTTVCIGLAQALRRLGKTAIPALREPAMGPVFGTKGGGCGGGYSQVLPMEDINLAFTGDIPAVTAAHNLLSALLDAHLHHGNALKLDVRKITWPRAVDMNDRALRRVIVGLGDVVREDEFVITPASEVMAILSLSRSIEELRTRLGRIIAGFTADGGVVTAADLNGQGAMSALLRDAIRPNLVQTVEGGPALVHTGPFANIAHGSCSVLAIETGLTLSEFVVTEAGFGADLGAEKFMNIVCRVLGRGPDAVVIVVTIRALKHHGHGDLVKGFANLARHISHLEYYGVPMVVAVNRFESDSETELQAVADWCATNGIEAAISDAWTGGGAGCEHLAEVVQKACVRPANFRHLYDVCEPAIEKLHKIARVAYGAKSCSLSESAAEQIEWATDHGFSDAPICVAKTPLSFTANSKITGVPDEFEVSIREISLSAGAGFLVAYVGDVHLMPGLGHRPAAFHIDVSADGRIVGLS